MAGERDMTDIEGLLDRLRGCAEFNECLQEDSRAAIIEAADWIADRADRPTFADGLRAAAEYLNRERIRISFDGGGQRWLSHEVDELLRQHHAAILALTAPPASPGDGWRDISTAPNDDGQAQIMVEWRGQGQREAWIGNGQAGEYGRRNAYAWWWEALGHSGLTETELLAKHAVEQNIWQSLDAMGLASNPAKETGE